MSPLVGSTGSTQARRSLVRRVPRARRVSPRRRVRRHPRSRRRRRSGARRVAARTPSRHPHAARTVDRRDAGCSTSSSDSTSTSSRSATRSATTAATSATSAPSTTASTCPRTRTATRSEKDDFLVYIGRANHDKGPVEAIEIARRAGLELTMIVKHNEPLEQALLRPRGRAPARRRHRDARERPPRGQGRPARTGTGHDLPDPLARALRAGDGRGDGVRHARSSPRIGARRPSWSTTASPGSAGTAPTTSSPRSGGSTRSTRRPAAPGWRSVSRPQAMVRGYCDLYDEVATS